MRASRKAAVTAALMSIAGIAFATQAAAAPSIIGAANSDDHAADVAALWTPAKRAAAIGRDIVVDSEGRSFIGKPGALAPYGSGKPLASVSAASPKPTKGKPGGSTGDTTAPAISGRDPGSGTTLTTPDRVFSASVVDPSGVSSVAFVLTYPSGLTRSYPASKGSGDVWSISFSGFTDGSWGWSVVAKDLAPNGGNTATSSTLPFVVSLATEPPPAPGDVANASWATPSPVTSASGRLYFEMPTNKRANRWGGYVCSATAVADGDVFDGRSLILTAAHCVYDEASGYFARNVMFIPNQQASGTATDRNCTNDVMGCWVPTAGVVDKDWTTRQWPDNIPWDYGYYVVPNSGAHTGDGESALERVVPAMSISFATPVQGRTSAFGYSYSEDPKLMYCAQARGFTGGTSAGAADNWWLDKCGLSGGASGGPWLDESTVAGEGSIISVNSWGYSGSPGMAGPKLDGSNATYRARTPECVFTAAKNATATPNIKVASC